MTHATAPLVEGVVMNQNKAELKDSVTSCEWQSPDLFWPEMEAKPSQRQPVFQ